MLCDDVSDFNDEGMYIAVSSKRREIGKSGLTFHLFS